MTMRASFAGVRGRAAGSSRSPTATLMNTPSVSTRHLTDHYPSAAIGHHPRRRCSIDRAGRPPGTSRIANRIIDVAKDAWFPADLGPGDHVGRFPRCSS